MSTIQPGGWQGVPYELPEEPEAGPESAASSSHAAPSAAPAPSGPPLDRAKVAALESALATQPQAALSKTIAAASKQSPREYRAALRSTLEKSLGDAPKLQKHLAMLDANEDGKVTPKENYDTLRSLGFSPAKALAVAGASQLALVLSTGNKGGFSFATDGGDAGRHKAVDTGAMDPTQDLSKKLDEMMAQDLDGDGTINVEDIGRYIDKRADASNAGTIAKTLTKAANKAEFASLFQLTGGKMSRDDLRDFYTGSLFFSLLPPDALAQRLVGLRGK